MKHNLNHTMHRGAGAKSFIEFANVCVRIERVGVDFLSDICLGASMLSCDVQRGLSGARPVAMWTVLFVIGRYLR